jgi:hypothetical protein
MATDSYRVSFQRTTDLMYIKGHAGSKLQTIYIKSIKKKEKQLQNRVKRDGKNLLEWIRIHSLRGLPDLAGPELRFSRTLTASVLRNDACLRLPARNKYCSKASE